MNVERFRHSLRRRKKRTRSSCSEQIQLISAMKIKSSNLRVNYYLHLPHRLCLKLLFI